MSRLNAPCGERTQPCHPRQFRRKAPESIYNMVPRTKIIAPKPPVHVSPYVEKVKYEIAKPKESHRTFGYEKTPLRGVDCYLRAHEKEFVLPPVRRFHYGCVKRPGIPKDVPHLGFKTKEDIIHKNAVANICSIPANPHRIYVDTRKGDKNLLDPSGLIPKYIASKTYGRVPPYITKKNKEMEQAKRDYKEYVNALFSGRQRSVPVLPEEERLRIVEGLKTNWEKHNKEFLALPMILDTISQVQRKERLEREMAQLERDIDLIESHTTIYVS